MDKTPAYLPEIDLLRGVAVLLVIFHHLSEPTFGILQPWVPEVLTETWTGVDIFFVISGFVIYRSLRENGFEAGDKRPSLRAVGHFFWRRFWRIFPAAFFWAVIPLAVVVAAGGFSATTTPEKIWDNFRSIVTLTFNYDLVYTKDNSVLLGPYWSLIVEEHFYLLLPWLLLLLPGRRSRILLCSSMILLTPLLFRPLGWVFLNPVNQVFYFRCSTHCRLDGLFLGVLLAELNPASFLKMKFSRIGMNCVSLVVIGLIAVAQWMISSALTYNIALSLLALASGLLVLMASLGQGYVLQIPFLRPVLLWVGKRSFSFYLAHMPVYFLVVGLFSANFRNLNGGEIGRMALLFSVLLTFAAYASYRWIERPLIAFGRGWMSEQRD